MSAAAPALAAVGRTRLCAGLARLRANATGAGRRAPQVAPLRLCAGLALLLAGCAGAGREAPYDLAALPQAQGFGAGLPVGGTEYGNDSLAELLVTLTFDTEWGDSRQTLLKYPGPVRVALQGPGAERYVGFLDGYLAQLRDRAGIDIARAGDVSPGRDGSAEPPTVGGGGVPPVGGGGAGSPVGGGGDVPPVGDGDAGSPVGDGAANMQVRFVEAAAFQALLPSLSCLVAPGDLQWEAFARDPRTHGTRASVTATEPGQTIFIPQSAEPETIRACLIEEIAQGLGPANDLWGVGPTIFNDDAAHLWPTGLDYLMLRLLYRPDLVKGAGRAEVRAAARAVLAQLNPGGETAAPLPPWRARELAGWRNLMQRAHARDLTPDEQIDLAIRAYDIARTQAPGSAQDCQSLVMLGNTLPPPAALEQFEAAAALCSSVHGPGDIRLARIALAQAGAEAALDRPDLVLALTDQVLAPFTALGQGYGLAWAYHLRADAYSLQGRLAQAVEARDLALAWGAYAYGADHGTLADWRQEWGLDG